MSNFGNSAESIPTSEEVDAYPFIKKMLRVDFVQIALNEVDMERRKGFILAAIFKNNVFEDMLKCRAIERAENFNDYACRPHSPLPPFSRPKHF